MIKIFMVQNIDGMVKFVNFFDEDGKMRKADCSALKLKSENVDFEKLAKMIEVQMKYN